ncbi:MAG: alpha/beta fold hydrolase, partial [Actinomycetes bacterium]
MSTPPFLALPACARPRHLPVSRGELAAIESLPADVTDGQGRAGQDPTAPEAPCAILVPGFTGSKEDFIAILEPLARRGIHPVAYDQYGQYESDRDDDPRSYSIPAFAADLVHLAKELGPVRPHLVGHSFGGLVARAAVIAAPESFASLTLLCSGPAGLPKDQSVALQTLMESLGQTSLDEVWAVHRADAEAAGEPEPPWEIREFLHRRFVANSPLALAEMARALMHTEDRTAELDEC